MKKSISFILPILGVVFFTFSCFTGPKEPWKPSQLMDPAELAAQINNGTDQNIHIFSIGPSGAIKHATDIGPAGEQKNLDALRTAVSKLPKDDRIVIYCGCCPFEHCPNVRPAFNLLTSMGFTEHKLLNLPHNLKTDWIDKGYPMAE